MTRKRPVASGTEGWQASFVEELGALSHEIGVPRATMRITAWMMVCDPPEQSAPQIQDGVQLSPAAMSAATRELIAAGMLERISRPGDRRIYYRLASGSWDVPYKQNPGTGTPTPSRRPGHRRRRQPSRLPLN